MSVQRLKRLSIVRDGSVVGIVSNGVVHLWSVAPSNIVREAYEVATGSVPGVKKVEMQHAHGASRRGTDRPVAAGTHRWWARFDRC